MADWLAVARRQFDRANTITLRRLPSTDITVRAKGAGFRPDELVGGINQRDRQIRILAEDVTFSPALKPGDKAILQGRVMNIDDVDDTTGRAGNVLVFYIVRVKG